MKGWSEGKNKEAEGLIFITGFKRKELENNEFNIKISEKGLKKKTEVWGEDFCLLDKFLNILYSPNYLKLCDFFKSKPGQKQPR